MDRARVSYKLPALHHRLRHCRQEHNLLSRRLQHQCNYGTLELAQSPALGKIQPADADSQTCQDHFIVATRTFVSRMPRSCKSCPCSVCDRFSGSSCSSAVYPTTDEEMLAVAASLGVPCTTLNSGYYQRPHWSSGDCYYGDSTITCDSTSPNGWTPICYCPQASSSPTPSLTAG